MLTLYSMIQSPNVVWLFGRWKTEGLCLSVSLFQNYPVPDTVSILKEWRPKALREVLTLQALLQDSIRKNWPRRHLNFCGSL